MILYLISKTDNKKNNYIYMNKALVEQIFKYRNLINPNNSNISFGIVQLIKVQNINNPIIGGEIKKFTFDNKKIKANIVYNDEFDNLNIKVINLNDNSNECGVILIHKDKKRVAIIEKITGNKDSYKSSSNRSDEGKIIMKIMIELCRQNKIKKIKLGDRSHKLIGKYNFDLSIYNTLINGQPLYSQFRFINDKEEEQEKIKENYKKLNNKKVKYFQKEIFINKKFMDIYDKYKENDIKEFIRMLSIYDINIFYDIHIKLYENLKLQYIFFREYYLYL